jgi:predicted nuclease of predicted toxin-antitoxin system
MPDFFLDHNTKQRIGRELIAQGHTAVTAISQQHDRATDPEILLTAVEQGRIIVTYNREDFRMLHDAWLRWRVAPEHSGILVIPEVWSPQQAAQEISQFLSSNPNLRNTLWDWRASVGWVQFDPLSQER